MTANQLLDKIYEKYSIEELKHVENSIILGWETRLLAIKYKLGGNTDIKNYKKLLDIL